MRVLPQVGQLYFLLEVPNINPARHGGEEEEEEVSVRDAGSIKWVVLQGTTCTANLLSDLHYRQVWSEALGMRVHRGFKRVAEAVYDDLRPLLGNPADAKPRLP